MIDDMSVCDDLVDVFEANQASHRPGVVGRDGGAVVDPSRKESMEMSFMPNDPRPAWRRYRAALQQVMPKYVEKYPYAANYVGPWGLSSATNFQHYPPGGGYKVFHTERKDSSEPVSCGQVLITSMVRFGNKRKDRGQIASAHRSLSYSQICTIYSFLFFTQGCVAASCVHDLLKRR